MSPFQKTLGAAFVTLGLSVGSAAHAGQTCTPTADGTGQSCEVGVRSTAVDATIGKVRGQRMSQWCWAASIAMLFRYYGYDVSQQRIVAETFGEVVNLPGTDEQILVNLDRVWTDDHGRRFRVRADTDTASPDTAAADLAADRPLIIGTLGHAMVLTAMGYVIDPNGGDRVTHAVVRDPWPGAGRRELSEDEWENADLLVRVSVAAVGADAADADAEDALNPR